MSDRTAGLVGIAGCILFWISLFVFGAMRPEYSQQTKVVASGLGFAGTGIIPAEMRGGSPALDSPYTIGHIIMTFISGVPWMVATFLLAGPTKQNVDWRVMGNVSLALGFMAIACFGLRATTILPGVAQRISFAVYFAWFLVMSIQLLRVQRAAHR